MYLFNISRKCKPFLKLPNLKEIFHKHWHILNINPDYREIFKTPPRIAFQKHVSLKQIAGTTIIRNNRKYLNPANFFSKGKCTPCYGTRTMCCKQVNTTVIFTTNQTNEIFDIYHSLNYKRRYAIYLLECSIFKIQYAGKSETLFNKRLSNHRKDIKDPSAIPACKHSNSPNHDLNTYGKFTIVEQLRNITSSSSEIHKDLNKKKTFGLKNKKTLAPSV